MTLRKKNLAKSAVGNQSDFVHQDAPSKDVESLLILNMFCLKNVWRCHVQLDHSGKNILKVSPRSWMLLLTPADFLEFFGAEHVFFLIEVQNHPRRHHFQKRTVLLQTWIILHTSCLAAMRFRNPQGHGIKQLS